VKGVSVENMSRYNKYPRICFAAHFAYGAMAGGNSGHIGGVERQTSLMARWFAERGYPTSMLTWDEGQEDGVKIDGVRVLRMCRKDAGIKGLRFLWPKWTSLIAAMTRADADIYYQNCAGYVTGQVAFWCRRHGRRFVFSAAADTQCEAKLPYLPTVRERVLYRYGLTHADRVIVQTRKQQGLLQANFERDSLVLPMPCIGPSKEGYGDSALERNDSRRVLWIGRICEVKRPDRLLDLAELCPDLSFDLVGPAVDTEYAHSICQRARTIANIAMHGPATREHVPEFYRQANVLCCTSDSEGFPNTFLEAWSHGLPIVSTFDPDNLIAEKGLGVVAQDVPGLADGIRSLCGSPEQRHIMSMRARQSYLESHTVDVAMAKFEKTFLDLYRRSISSGAEKYQF
jgi:glycosyltransferase involved in cell wall biosynthesis